MALAGSWSDVGGAHIQAFTFSSQDHGRLSTVLWCVWRGFFFITVCVVVVCVVVVCCVLCVYMWRVWCVCGVGVVCVRVLWWCVCVVSGDSYGTLSLSCSLSFLFSFPYFFSLIFYFSLLLSFSLAPSLILALALVLSLSLLSSFFPSTHSSLLFPSRQQTLYKALINKHGVQL